MRNRLVAVLVAILLAGSLVSCDEASRVSHNISKEADNFNVERKITVINQRTDTILFQMQGNFSISNSSGGELAVIGANDGGYYKHYIYLSDEITYIVEDMGVRDVNTAKYTIRFNPNMVIPIEVDVVD